MQYIPKHHLTPQHLPKPPAGTLRSKHLPPSSVGLSPGSSRSTSLKNVGSICSLPSVPSLESQASPPYPHCGRHPLHRYNLVCTRIPQKNASGRHAHVWEELQDICELGFWSTTSKLCSHAERRLSCMSGFLGLFLHGRLRKVTVELSGAFRLSLT